MSDFKSAIYGWSIVWQPNPADPWQVDDNEEANGLPAIFEDWGTAVDRLKYLETKNIKCRMVAVLVHPSDFSIDGTNKFDSNLRTPVDGWWPHKPTETTEDCTDEDH